MREDCDAASTSDIRHTPGLTGTVVVGERSGHAR
jgi:hypothetical protein